MRTYVSTLGYHETRVTRPVLRHGLDDGDAVVIVRPTADDNPERSKASLDHVRNILSEVAANATVAVERIDCDDLVTAVERCCGVFSSAEGEVVVNFGGGPREAFLPLTIAATMCAREIDLAFQYTDVDQNVREIQLPHLVASVPSEAESTLRILAGEETEWSLSEVASRSEKSRSTITRHVSKLADRGLVETRQEGKMKFVTVTPTGRLAVRSSR